MDDLELCLYDLESFQMILKVSGRSKKCPDHPENVAGLSKILQNHLLCAFVADLKIDAIYALYPECFCAKNLAIRKVFAFCDSVTSIKRDFDSSMKSDKSEYYLKNNQVERFYTCKEFSF